MDSETVKLAVQIAEVMCGCGKKEPKAYGHWEIGKNYFIRTVTHHLTGRLIDVTEHELWLEDAAWIADNGRFSQAMETGSFNEIEPFPSGRKVAVGRGALIDAMLISFSLPRSQK